MCFGFLLEQIEIVAAFVLALDDDLAVETDLLKQGFARSSFDPQQTTQQNQYLAADILQWGVDLGVLTDFDQLLVRQSPRNKL